MTAPIVSIVNLTYAYGQRVALNALSLEVHRGEIFGFLGPNGSGKTTLFRILSTLIPAPKNTVTLLGFDASGPLEDIRQRIGVVFQSPSLDKQLTAEENLRHHGHLYGLHGRELENRIQLQLQRVGLIDRARDRVNDFSGGMRRRVELAKGLLNQPEILLLDEPCTGLDPSARIDLWKSLKEIQASGVTILLTTHLMDEADRCTRLAIMEAGQMVCCNTPIALKEMVGGDVISIVSNDPAALEIRIKEALNLTAQRMENVLRFQQAKGHEFVPRVIEIAPQLVDSISVGRPTLEDVFIQMTGKKFVSEDLSRSPS